MHRYATLLLSFLAGFLSQRRIFPLLFLIAGVLLLQSVQAQTTVITPPLVDPPLIGPNLTAPTGMFDVFGVTTDAANLYTHDGGISRRPRVEARQRSKP